MYLLALLFVPLVVGIVAAVIGKGELTLKELAVQELVIVVLIGVTYGLSVLIVRHSRTADTEIWNGRIASKTKESGSCCHSYKCNPHDCMCDTNGNCSTCWDTCYKHSRDDEWWSRTTNGEIVYKNVCNAPGSAAPSRWSAIVVGEPTSIEHSYTNYIKGNPSTIMKKSGAIEKFPGLIPTYPRVYDHYRAKPFISVKVPVKAAELKRLNAKLNEINANVGRPRQANIIVVVVKTNDIGYTHALEQAWLGGKKNDIVVVVGMPAGGEMAFASVMSWSKSEEMKLSIRDRIMELGQFDGGKVLDIVSSEVKAKFVRREMADYEYLMEAVEPPVWLLVIIFVVGVAASVVLSVYFIRNDPFGDGHRNRFYRRRWR